MKISVVGFDPSLNAWGIAKSELDLTTGYLDTPILEVVEPMELTSKQVRGNSKDLYRGQQLAKAAIEAIQGAKAIFVEIPVGSQSARAMASYGICIGILSTLLATGIQLIEVTATEVKLALSGNEHASKKQMINCAVALYPNANFPRYTQNGAKFRKGDIADKSEHAADAIGAIHAGVNTPLFQNLMKLYTR